MRYTLWGEVRYNWTATQVTTPAYSLPKFTFTGQYSYMDDPSTSGVTEGFGLMFYNARWYDPALGRFAQADSIIPPGVQGLDRYAYVNNSPMNYTDPSGHICVEDDGDSDVGMAGNCNGGSNPNYTPGLQGPSWKDNEEELTYGNGLTGPPEPNNITATSALNGLPDTNTMHPIDIFLQNKNTFGAYVSVYSSTGELIGVRRVGYIPDYSTTRFNKDIFSELLKNRIDNAVSDQLLKTAELVGSKTMFAIAKRFSAASNVYDAINLANNAINIDGRIQVNNNIIHIDPSAREGFESFMSDMRKITNPHLLFQIR